MCYALLLLIIIPIVLVTTILIIYKKSWFISRYIKHVPGPKGLPFIGNALEFRDTSQILAKFLEYLRTYGRIVKIQIGADMMLLVSEPKFLETIFTSTKVLKKAPEYNQLLKWLGTGLLTSTGRKWQQRRKAITPTFHYNILEQFIETFDSNSNILAKKLEEHLMDDFVDLYPLITLYTLDVICETAMGISVNAQIEKNSDYVNAVRSMGSLIVMRSFSPLKRFDAIYRLTNDYNIEKGHLKILHGTTESVIKKRRSILLNNNTSEENNSQLGIKKKVAFLDMLLNCQINGQKLTDFDIREEVDTFMFEGHDTTSSAISFCLFALSQHPEIQTKAYEEVFSIFGADKTRLITYQDLQNMRYLDLVIKESLRLYPSVPTYGRQLTTDITYDGKIYPAGLILFLFALGLHRDPKLYPEPNKFIPERFLNGNNATKEQSAFSYIPFSAGQRNCIGQKFAMLEIKSAVSKILRNFELLAVEGFEPVLLFEMILKSRDGIPVKLKKR